MTMIPLERLRSNPYRDFELHPYDPDQTGKLKASIDSDGFWMSVVARPAGDDYEIAFGHHRIEAARQLGWTDVPIEVRDLTDWEMARMLASENATQRGSTAAACLDAVSALSQVIAYRLLRWEKEPEDAENSALSDGFSHELCRGWLLSGEGVGRVCIEATATKGSFTRDQIEGALATLKDSGRMTAIVAQARAKVDAELRAEQEAAEREAAEAERREAGARTKRERGAATKAKNSANRKARKARKSKKATETAETATRRKNPIKYDPRCAHLFRLDSHAEVFRKEITDPVMRDYLPLSKQFAFAKAVIAKATENAPRGHSMTAADIRRECWSLIETGTGWARSKLRTAPIRPYQFEVRDGLNFIRRAAADLQRGVDLLLRAERKGVTMDAEQKAVLGTLIADITDGLEPVKTLWGRKPLQIVGGKETQS